jgi:hypothetical protein
MHEKEQTLFNNLALNSNDYIYFFLLSWFLKDPTIFNAPFNDMKMDTIYTFIWTIIQQIETDKHLNICLVKMIHLDILLEEIPIP